MIYVCPINASRTYSSEIRLNRNVVSSHSEGIREEISQGFKIFEVSSGISLGKFCWLSKVFKATGKFGTHSRHYGEGKSSNYRANPKDSRLYDPASWIKSMLCVRQAMGDHVFQRL